MGQPLDLLGQALGVEPLDGLHDPGVERAPPVLKHAPVGDLMREHNNPQERCRSQYHTFHVRPRLLRLRLDGTPRNMLGLPYAFAAGGAIRWARAIGPSTSEIIGVYGSTWFPSQRAVTSSPPDLTIPTRQTGACPRLPQLDTRVRASQSSNSGTPRVSLLRRHHLETLDEGLDFGPQRVDQ